jgi:uncharacterized surface protein with fasciclin (FAS1) repeats
MLFCFNCEKHGHIEIECHEGNETEKLIEKLGNYKEELISSLDELREENNSLKNELMKQKESVHIFEESQQVFENLRTQLEEAIKIEENIEYEKQCLETNIATQKKEEEMREKILTYHLKERNNDLNQLEEKFGQEEKGLEEEIITLKIHLKEAKKTEEVMKYQIMKKEEEVVNLE